MDKQKTPPIQEVHTKVKLIQQDLFEIKNDLKIIKQRLNELIKAKEKEKDEIISSGWWWYG